jgi:HTH-type transcriptional regulator / antitoxin HigA
MAGEKNFGTAGRLETYPPGALIAEELEARDWSQEDLARITGRPLGTINEIVKGKKAITIETSLDLAAAFGTSPDLWLGLENDYRLGLSEHGRSDVERRSRIYSRAPVRELQKRGVLRQTDDLDLLEREVCKLLHINSIDEDPDLDSMGIAARKSDGYTGSYTPSQITWLFLARREAETLKISEFQESVFSESVAELPKLSVNEAEWRKVRSELCRWGIRLVFVEPLSGTKIDGALFWLSATAPVIALSMRYDRVDHFWFTLMHELGHLSAKSSSRRGHVDAELVGPEARKTSDKPPEEQRADRRASEWLIPQNAIKLYLKSRRPQFSKANIIALACQLGRHPGIVVGRLQHEGKMSYSHCRDLLVKVRESLMN